MNTQDYLNSNIENIVSFKIHDGYIDIYMKDGSNVHVHSNTNDGDLHVEHYNKKLEV